MRRISPAEEQCARGRSAAPLRSIGPSSVRMPSALEPATGGDQSTIKCKRPRSARRCLQMSGAAPSGRGAQSAAASCSARRCHASLSHHHHQLPLAHGAVCPTALVPLAASAADGAVCPLPPLPLAALSASRCSANVAPGAVLQCGRGTRRCASHYSSPSFPAIWPHASSLRRRPGEAQGESSCQGSL